MKKYLLRYIFCTLAITLPCIANAHTDEIPYEAEQMMSEDIGEVNFTIKDRTIHIQNAQGAVLEIFNVTGVKVASYRIDSMSATFSLNLGKGCYIIRIGKLTRKIALS